MSNVKPTVIALIEQIAKDDKKTVPPLTDDLVLLESGLDSLAFAIVVARLEDSLGIDPFSASEDVQFPVTFGDFIQMYEKMHANAAT